MRFLIDFKNDVDQAVIDQYLIDNNCQLIKKYDAFNNVYLVNSLQVPPIADIIEIINNNDEMTITPHLVFENTSMDNYDKTLNVQVNTDDQWWMTYSLEGVDLDSDNIAIPKRGKGINVYLIDSGIDSSHTEFSNANITLLHSFNSDFHDYNGHGTALASVIVGETCGLTDCNLKVVKIFQNNVPMHLSDLLDALEAVIVDIGQNSESYSVVNMSWSIDKNLYVENKIKLIKEIGAMPVTAAGNSSVPIENVTPASLFECFVIGSYNQDFTPSVFSNYTTSDLVTTPGETNYGRLDAWSPGENIRAAVPGGGYKLVSGTSISAAIFSGAVAYNASYFLDSQNSLSSSMMLDSKKMCYAWFKFLSIAKYKILNLSDPKYSSSVNYTTAYRVGDMVTDTLLFNPELNSIAYDNQSTGIILGAPWIYKNIEITSTNGSIVPPGIAINNGYFNWNLANVLNGGSAEVFKFQVSLTRNNNVVDTMNLEILVVPENSIDFANRNTGDPVIDSFSLKLGNTCGNGAGSTYDQCIQSYCSFQQTQFCQCCDGDIKTNVCYANKCFCSNESCP
jgi:hypothetical protein